MDCDRGDKFRGVGGGGYFPYTDSCNDRFMRILDFNPVFFLNVFIEALENER